MANSRIEFYVPSRCQTSSTCSRESEALMCPTSACSRLRFSVWYRGQNWLCDVLRVVAYFGKVAARLTRRALGRLEPLSSSVPLAA